MARLASPVRVAIAADRRPTMGEMWIDGAEASLRLDGEGRLFRRARGAPTEAGAWQRP